MSSIAIKVENLSKAYQLGQIGTGTISRDMERWYARVRGKDDPFLRIGESNASTSSAQVLRKNEMVWSLKDVNFEIEQGEAVGIIGRNGAGKSTLLKILSKVTAPTTGKISGKGRIASLLEVGTGFHPELSGRENIFLNGAILGMRKKEIARKLDEIVDFAGVERYLDTPVKRYSSGMYVRLAFAVAAHLESEILIVDEVLAVGDAEFQKKCLGKMSEVSKGEGRTVLFVSHNMGMISNLCETSIVLENGSISRFAKSSSAIKKYLEKTTVANSNQTKLQLQTCGKDHEVQLYDAEILQHFANSNNFLSTKNIEIAIDLEIKKEILGLRIGFEIYTATTDICVFRTYHDDMDLETKAIAAGKFKFQSVIPANLLSTGEYVFYPAIGLHNVGWINHRLQQINFNILNIEGVNALYSDDRPGIIAPKIDWKKYEI